jgi:hypothetical protein
MKIGVIDMFDSLPVLGPRTNYSPTSATIYAVQQRQVVENGEKGTGERKSKPFKADKPAQRKTRRKNRSSVSAY